jgi:hypothetical protein
MGMDDRDGAFRSRGQPPRRRPYDGADAPARSSSRGPREMDSPRSRPPRREYESDREYDRPARDPRGAPRGGSSGRHERDEQAPHSRSGGPPRGDRRGYDDYGRFSRSDPGAPSPRGARNMRSGRPAERDDAWGDPRGGRVAGSNGRMRRPPQAGGRGGLWADEAQPYGAPNTRDPRARRLAAQQEEDEEGSPGAGFAKALGAIVLALALGAGSAYGYFIVSVPKLHVPAGQQSTPTAVPSTTPSTTPSPSATKSALLHPPGAERTLLIG